jgi:uncharacterized protein (TIGR03435 family)
MRGLLVAWLALSPITHLAAQEFEVASIKSIEPNAPRSVGIQIQPGARVVISGLSLKALVAAAFGLSYWQVSGGEPWTEHDSYIVEAVPDRQVRESTGDLRHTLFTIEDERLRKMLQALLIARFQLRVHQEKKAGDVYLLQRSGKPLKLRASEAGADAGFGSIGYAGGAWVMTATTMPQLATFASAHVLRTPVRDETGLSGSFDYRQSVPDAEPKYGDNSDSFRRLLPELGLKLERVKGMVDVLVIDSAAKPSPN